MEIFAINPSATLLVSGVPARRIRLEALRE